MKILASIRCATAAALILGGTSAIAEPVVHAHGNYTNEKHFEEIGKLSGVDYKQLSYSVPEQFKGYVAQSIAADDMPDVLIWWSGDTFNELVGTGKIAPLTDLWDEMIAKGEFSASAKGPYSVDGVPYAFPFISPNWVVYYHKDAFESAGIETTPKTWDELEEVVAKLQSKGVTPFQATTSGGWRGFIWFEEILMGMDPDAYAGLFTGKTTYDSKPVQAAFQKWSELYAEGWFTDPRTTTPNQDFVGKKSAMFLTGENFAGTFQGMGMDIDNDMGVFVLPNINPSITYEQVIVEPTPIMLTNAGIKNPDAIKFFKTFISAEGSKEISAANGLTNLNLNAGFPNKISEEVARQIAENDVKPVLRWWESTPGSLQGDLVAELNRFMLDPTMDTAEKVMKNMKYLNSSYWADTK